MYTCLCRHPVVKGWKPPFSFTTAVLSCATRGRLRSVSRWVESFDETSATHPKCWDLERRLHFHLGKWYCARSVHITDRGVTAKWTSIVDSSHQLIAPFLLSVQSYTPQRIIVFILYLASGLPMPSVDGIYLFLPFIGIVLKGLQWLYLDWNPWFVWRLPVN